MTDWKQDEANRFFKDADVVLLFAGAGLSTLAAWSAYTSCRNLIEASEEATPKNLGTGLVSAGVTAASASVSYLAISAGWNYTRYLEKQVDQIAHNMKAISDKYPLITQAP